MLMLFHFPVKLNAGKAIVGSNVVMCYKKTSYRNSHALPIRSKHSLDNPAWNTVWYTCCSKSYKLHGKNCTRSIWLLIMLRSLLAIRLWKEMEKNKLKKKNAFMMEHRALFSATDGLWLHDYGTRRPETSGLRSCNRQWRYQIWFSLHTLFDLLPFGAEFTDDSEVDA